MSALAQRFSVDWVLLFFIAPLVLFSLVSINSFGEASNVLFQKQLLWLAVSLTVFVILSYFDFRFLKNSKILTLLFIATCALLGSLFIFGSVFSGAQSWFNFGFFAFQPVDIAKVMLILILAKQFPERHV